MAKIEYLVHIDLTGNELQNAVIQNLSTAPGSPSAGQIYYDIEDGNIYMWDGVGTAWVDLTSQGSGSTNLAWVPSPTTGVITSSTGTDATITLATGINSGLQAPAHFTLVSGIISGTNYGDITTSASGATWTINAGAVTLAKMADVATGTVFYRKTVGTGSPEVQTLATLKTDLGLTGTNSGDQTATLIAGVGLSGTTYDPNTSTTFALAVDELAEKTGTVVGTDRLVGTTGTTNWAETISNIPLSVFDNTATAFTSNLGTVTSVSSGNGMSFTTITTSGAVTLGTPSSLTSSTTNAVTATSHTHAIDISGFASTVLSDTANIVYTNLARTISVTHTIATGSKLTLTDLPSAGTDAANKNYVDSILASNDAMIFKGTVGTGGTLTIAAFNALVVYDAGWTYKIIEAGTVKGNVVEVGDMIIATVDRASAGVNADWVVVQSNLDGAVIGPASATDSAIALFDGTSGKLIKNSSVTLGSFIPVAGATTQMLQWASSGTAKWITLSSDVTIADGGAVTIGNNRVSYAKMQQASVGYTIMAKATTGAGNYAELTAAADTVLRRSGTGDLAFGTLVTNNLGNNIVTYAKIQTMATQTFLGRNTAGTGNVEALTVAQMQALIAPNASETVKGIVEEATDAEVAAGTAVGTTGARLYVNPAKLATSLGTPGGEGSTTRRKTFATAAALTTVCTHSFGDRFVQVQVFRTLTPFDRVMAEVTLTSTTQCTVTFNTAPAAGEYTILVIG